MIAAAKVWPRGLPLDEIAASDSISGAPTSEPALVWAPIQQGLADNAPDVDAVWRLTMDRIFHFDDRDSVYLKPGTWSPFNSQSTWWWPDAFPLLYLPSCCSFRMTDIWRSFIAQRCLWEIGAGLVFHGPEVFQDRNAHDLMRDFRDEIPGYTRNKDFIEVLERLTLDNDTTAVGDNLLHCYQSLIDAGFFADRERLLVDTWLRDLACIGK